MTITHSTTNHTSQKTPLADAFLSVPPPSFSHLGVIEPPKRLERTEFGMIVYVDHPYYVVTTPQLSERLGYSADVHVFEQEGWSGLKLPYTTSEYPYDIICTCNLGNKGCVLHGRPFGNPEYRILKVYPESSYLFDDRIVLTNEDLNHISSSNL